MKIARRPTKEYNQLIIDGLSNMKYHFAIEASLLYLPEAVSLMIYDAIEDLTWERE